MTDSTLVSQSLSLYADQFKDSENLNNLTRALLMPMDGIKQALEDLKDDRWIDTAVGEQLDQLGGIVGIRRLGRTDDQYRQAIRFQIFINLSKTEPETLISATRVLTNGTFLRYWEHSDGAGFNIFTNGLNVFSESDATFELVRFALSDEDLLALDTGDHLLIKTIFRKSFDLLIFLRSITAAGVDYITLTYSLGRTPLFGFGFEFETGKLKLSNGNYLAVTSPTVPTNLEVFTDKFSGVSPDNFLGFSELSPTAITLSDGTVLGVNVGGEDVPLYADFVGLSVGGGKLTEGTRDYG